MFKMCAAALAVPALVWAQDAASVLSDVTKAMGAGNVRTLQYSGTGSNAGIGQNVNPRAAWPVTRVKSYRRDIDFNAGTSHVELVRVQGAADQTQHQYNSPNLEWSPGQFGYYLTPFGFLKGAAANASTARPETVYGSKYTVVSFTLQGKYKVEGYVNGQNLLEKIQTWIPDDVMGDLLAEASFSDYKDFGGVKYPTLIVEKQGGFPVLIVAVSDVKPNATINIQVPAPPAAAPATVSVLSERVADGVYYLRGGSHHSVAVEFADHIAVIEAPQNEARSLAVIAEVKKLIPNKPIRYLINTHHHFDHSGGLRTYVDEGATIITHDVNKAFYENTLSAARTLNPDRLAQSRKKPVIEITGDKKVLTDGTRSLELHRIKGSQHNDGILLAFLPKEKILIEVDVYTPPAANAAPVATVNANTLNLVDNAEKLKLDFERILPLHGPGAVTRADLYAAVGKPAPDIAQILSAAPPPTAGPKGVAPAKAVALDGKAILENACTVCHGINRVSNLKLTPPEWTTIVDRMKGRGAEVNDAETKALLEYLVKTYGRQ
jgi:glyoxylase-like metal-dependent hydrolase (beta-lactamase superfamily II)